MKQLRIFLASFLVVSSGLLGTVTWEGTTASQAQNDATIVNVVDQDLIVNGDVQLPMGIVSIAALTADVNVHFNGGPNPSDTTIRSNDNEVVAGNSVLYLVTTPGHKIIFHIKDSNVRFRGTNIHPSLYLTIVAVASVPMDGGGEVHFVFENPDKTLQFTARPNSGGCKFYVHPVAVNGHPVVYFQTPHATNKVIVGANDSSLGLLVGGLSNVSYQGFIFDGTGTPGSYSNLDMKAFSGISLQTTT